ncbi:MAG: hypothetical protein U9N63_00770 [Pseudomonadota bacterium]|nr:hypothetical protein [Pseudomonadota bacterium]
MTSIKAVAELCMALDKDGKMVDAASANRALENLGRHLGLFTDKQEQAITGPDGGPVIVVSAPAQLPFDEWVRRAKAELLGEKSSAELVDEKTV